MGRNVTKTEPPGCRLEFSIANSKNPLDISFPIKKLFSEIADKITPNDYFQNVLWLNNLGERTWSQSNTHHYLQLLRVEISSIATFSKTSKTSSILTIQSFFHALVIFFLAWFWLKLFIYAKLLAIKSNNLWVNHSKLNLKRIIIVFWFSYRLNEINSYLFKAICKPSFKNPSHLPGMPQFLACSPSNSFASEEQGLYLHAWNTICGLVYTSLHNFPLLSMLMIKHFYLLAIEDADYIFLFLISWSSCMIEFTGLWTYI